MISKRASRHHKDFLKVALVGDQAWEGRLAAVIKYVVDADVRYFDHAELRDRWVLVAE